MLVDLPTTANALHNCEIVFILKMLYITILNIFYFLIVEKINI